MVKNLWCQRLNVATPIMQAPMAGASNPAFVAAACQAGALGSLGAGMMSPELMVEQIERVKSLTDRSFAVNLMILPEELTENYSAPVPAWLDDCYQQLGLRYDLEEHPAPNFAKQFEVLLEHPVPVASFTFGILTPKQVGELHDRGSLVVGTANCADEVLAWARVGADAVVVQGSQAGGHRGGWLHEESTPITTAELLDQALWALTDQSLSLPLIAAGGVANRQIAAQYLQQGASMVGVGTAFLTTHESIIHPVWKQRLLQAWPQTALTRLFSGKLARGLVNQFMKDFAHLDGLVRHPQLPTYPSLNAMTKPLRAHAAAKNDGEYLSLWAGQSVGECRAESIQELIERINPWLELSTD